MATEADHEPLARGRSALDAGDWSAARVAFEVALADGISPAADEGLARALWWQHDFEAAVTHMERAYAGFRDRGDDARAAFAGMWLAREHAAAFGNTAAAAGWYALAEGLIGARTDGAERGWLAIARAERASAPAMIGEDAALALEIARRTGERDLEAAALVRVGYAAIARGEVEGGMASVDEAMAAATGGDVHGLETIGDVICVGIAACEHATDWQRIEQWGQVVQRWLESHDHVSVLGFCYACCAEMFIASGQWEMAEELLTEGLGAMVAAKLRARCVHPAAKLAELRLLQGRLEEAEQLLAGYEEMPESTHPLALLYLARGEVAMAAAVLLRRLNALGEDNVLSAPPLALLVDVHVSQGDLASAEQAASRLSSVAQRSSIPRISAMAQHGRGRVSAALGDDDAPRHLERAIASFAEQGMALDAARARSDLGRALDATQPEVAVGEMKTALAEFERLGAPRDADAAAAFLRERGVAGRTGPKDVGTLTRREREVLVLLGEGLSNAEVAARLFISTKTAEHHVGNVLSKLHMRSRTEAAAFVARHALEIPSADQGRR